MLARRHNLYFAAFSCNFLLVCKASAGIIEYSVAEKKNRKFNTFNMTDEQCRFKLNVHKDKVYWASASSCKEFSDMHALDELDVLLKILICNQ